MVTFCWGFLNDLLFKEYVGTPRKKKGYVSITGTLGSGEITIFQENSESQWASLFKKKKNLPCLPISLILVDEYISANLVALISWIITMSFN